jgi:hypothetical protein
MIGAAATGAEPITSVVGAKDVVLAGWYTCEVVARPKDEVGGVP